MDPFGGGRDLSAAVLAAMIAPCARRGLGRLRAAPALRRISGLVPPFDAAVASGLPEVQAAAGHVGAGEPAKAVPLLRRAHEIMAGAMGPASEASLGVGMQLSGALYGTSELAEAASLLTAALESPAASSAGARVLLLAALSKCELAGGSADRALEHALRAVSVAESQPDGDCDTRLLHVAKGAAGLSLLSESLSAGAAPPAGLEEDALDALTAAARCCEPDDPGVLGALANLALAYRSFSHAEDALLTVREGLEAAEAHRGGGPAAPSFARGLGALCRLQVVLLLERAATGSGSSPKAAAADLEAAQEALSAALVTEKAVLGDGSPEAALSLSVLGRALHRREKAVSAEGLHRAAVDAAAAAAARGTPEGPARWVQAIVKEAYAELLEDWEDREATGAGLRAEATAIAEAAPPAARIVAEAVFPERAT